MVKKFTIVWVLAALVGWTHLIGAQEKEKPQGAEKEKPKQTETEKKEKPKGSVTLIFTNKGHTTTAKNPTKWPYPPQGETGDTHAKFTSEELAGALLSGVKYETGATWSAPSDPANAFLKNFEKKADSVTGSLNFTFKEKTEESATVEVTGKVAIRATEGDGKGKRNIDADLKGTFKVDKDSKITAFSVKGENIKVTGTWDAGQWGVQELTGEGTLQIELKGKSTVSKSDKEKPGKKQPRDDSDDPDEKFGPGNNAGQGAWEIPAFEPVIGISVSGWTKALNLNAEQVDKLKELMKEGWTQWGTGTGANAPSVVKIKKWIGDELKKSLSDEQKGKVDELVKKSMGSPFGPPEGSSEQNRNNRDRKKNEEKEEKQEKKENQNKQEKQEKKQDNNQNP